MGDRVYYHCRERNDAQKAIDTEYGKGKYTVRTASTESGGGEISVRGTSNSKSRSGTYLKNLREKQGE